MLSFQSGSSVNICFLEAGHIACGVTGSLKESSLGRGIAPSYHSVGFESSWLSDTVEF